jgi:hypothetical protein
VSTCAAFLGCTLPSEHASGHHFGGLPTNPVQYGDMDILTELEAYARAHGALVAGRGTTDDILAFIDWVRAVGRQEAA